MEDRQILNESIEFLENNNYNDGLIQDNKIVFILNDTMYRVRMPVQKEQAILDHQRNLEQLKYIREEGCITKKQLMKQIQEAGIFDFNKAEETRQQLITDLKQTWFILATLSNNDDINKCSEKINKIQNELKDLSIEISNLLFPSLENKLEKFIIEYSVFLCTDKCIDTDKWERAWISYDDYKNEDSGLLDKIASQMTWLIFNKRS